MYAANAYNTYKNNSVNFASKEQLLIMLLDGAVKFAGKAKQALLNKNIQEAHMNLVKTQDIFYELIVSLDVSKAGEWGESLRALYQFIVDKLADANMKKSVATLDEVMPFIEDVRDTWREAYKVSKGKA
ncbi:flagellar protein FliS [Clostridium pasteurianum DSM 525 = ATCC 6013]|uniref:Flagellar secretion chaperone FliS n=1 Tax=Clostridium pasteurianum DSM 525 = ATCC 6013 TaxID=1262449 RepID=A0A0H3J9M6_CLOPA|nr:flagellar export chaperone FliS [Clostridium pasteurianum]AJA47845.1 flagellar protein FliS [Clostridium pasteurianum DSM 525 = ATCC 6013]AJA51833.1 flagellar protein FliS [Clostridium pasteurianum DSM 525 = ATCC 6013]AOZ75136.1 flagellar export chaperone FliS [Clostridium pasteurianum DSM 525 = ATCC 6013]AOZ78931.1 flagellar export chaperone FliS [Clostridium pasteurianum]ELP59746.1 flagellar protein FliS [Clostridium pasteurianum DSM 525 = ATCC 6013]